MTKTPIPAALQRVTVHQDATQDDAARIEVDYTGGGDVAHLTVNPDLVDDTALSGYQVRAAIQAALEPLRRYNRTVTRRYGTYKAEQAEFEDAMTRAADEIEQLVHLTPTVAAAPALAPTARPAEVKNAALPDDFPEVEGLREIDVLTYQAARDATDDHLRTASGVGPKRLEAIREAVAAYYAPVE